MATECKVTVKKWYGTSEVIANKLINKYKPAQLKVLPSKLDWFLNTIDVLWGKTAALIKFSQAVVL